MTKRTAIFISALLAAAPVWAQTFQGGIRGTIQDTSGAAVSVAKVTLIDEGTGIARSTVSGNGGEYSFTAVNPATYTVSVEKPGFNKLDKKGTIVSTQEFLIVDLKLAVGDVTQSVNVTAEDTPLIETESASTGQMIDKQKLDDLPNMGRNPFYEGVKVSQNVTPGGDPKFNRMEDQSGSSQITIAGGPVRGNNYLLDGISITDSQNRAVIIPTVESVQEVKLQASTYDAEVGRTGGGTFNLFLRSGTNAIHGSAFGYTWMQDWLANTYFANANGRNADGTLKSPIANQPFYNYGGSIGGPVIIPKIYNGKNKTFWWITGEGYRQTEANTATLNVPTALERVGDFSQSFTSAAHTALQQMYYPTSATTRTPFPGNVIPKSQLSPVGLALAAYYPLPSQTTSFFGQPNYNATGIIYDRADQVTAKADHQITNWWRASASYLHYGSREESNAYFGFSDPGTPGQSMLVRHVDATQANTTLTPSPTTVIYLRFGFNRFPNRTYQLASQGIDLTKLGFPSSYVSQLPYDAIPVITMTGDMSTFGAGGLNQSNFYSRSFSATASKFMGRHSLKAGFDYRVIHDSGEQTVTPGAFSFDGTFTSSTPGKTVAGSGGAIASLLLGFPASGSVTTSLPLENHVGYYGFFVHDDFRLNSKVTINFGIRYEYETGLESELNSLIVGFDKTAVNPVQSQVKGLTTNGVLEYAGQNGYGTTAMRPNADKFAPRIGVAWNVMPKTTIRAGYGIFWAPFTFSLVNPLGYTYSTPYVASNDGNATPASSLSNPFPSGIQQPIGNGAGLNAGLGGQNIAFFSNDAHSTRVHQFSFDVQRELPAGFVLAVGYVGSITHNLIEGTPDVNINQLPDQYLSLGSQLNSSVPNPFIGTSGGVLNLASPTITLAKSLLPYPQFGTVAMQSSDLNHAIYNSVYFKAQKRLGHAINILTTYTWSKNEDASNGGAGNVFNAQQTTSQDNYNRAAEWGLATIDATNRWTTAINYELPFGTGRKFLARNKFLDIAVGGWAMNVQTTMQSGFPLAIYQTNNNSSIGTSVQRPNATGVDPSMSGSVESLLGDYINKAAFSIAPQFTFGNLSRTIPIRGPGQASTDFSMFKSYTFEKLKAQFRAEVFNLTNTPQFYGPNTNFSQASFGAITSQANFNRVFQLGVRFEY
ncbi:MAG TPA: carboxypeptidase regulatory-like domain-containing protein [Bryobacteraceae bacterium]|nr:carboxypeptidase regulatory-like domain-containing protein [Bryobacteraceae bacterium]